MMDLGIPAWLPLNDAVELIGSRLSGGAYADPLASFDSEVATFKDEQGPVSPLGLQYSGCA